MTDITPTQEDRDAAWEYRPEGFGPSDKSPWDAGTYDFFEQGEKILAFARHRKAAIASVIARATTPDAIKRAKLTYLNESEFCTDYGRETMQPMKAAITAALTERKS